MLEREHLALLCAPVLLLACADGGGVSGNAPIDDSSKPSIEKFLAAYHDAIDDRDAATLRASFVSDNRFAWHEDGSLRYPTVDALIEALTQQPSGMNFETKYADTAIVPLDGPIASVRTDFTTTVRNGETKVFEFGGVITMLLTRHDESWQIVSGHTSTHKKRG